MQTMIYRRIARMTVAAATVWSALALFGERQPLERYQSVIDRQMFGPLPPNFDPAKSPSEVSAKDARAQEQELSKEQEQLRSAIHFSVINVTPEGNIVVGFTDNSDPKKPVHYYLKVGESGGGWTVTEADPSANPASMTIAKGEVKVSLKIGENSANGGGTTSKAGRPGANLAGSRSNLPGGRLGGGMSGGASRGLGSLRERRAMREQQRAADAQAAAEARKLEAEKEAQRDAERAAEKAEREKEREEQRAQLLQIQEELRKAREAKAKEPAEPKGDGQGEGESDS